MVIKYLRRLLYLSIGILAMAVFLVAPVKARSVKAPPMQPTAFFTPTPDSNGQIIYTVQKDDSPWRIAAIAGISLEELYALNGLQPNDYITVGMELLLGYEGPQEATAVPEPLSTETPLQVEATPFVGSGEICVIIFIDENGNASFDEEEVALSGGQVSVVSVSGELAGERTTDDNPEGHCFKEIEEDDYNVSAAIPEEFNPTTAMNLAIRIQPGDVKYIQFGAQPSGAVNTANGDKPSGRSTILGAFGIILLAAAGILGYYASRYRKHTTSLHR